MNMAERIKYLRIKNNMTQEELGNKLGVQKSAVAKWEGGKVENIKKSTILKMSKLFNVKPSHIMGLDDYAVSDEEYAMLSMLMRPKPSYRQRENKASKFDVNITRKDMEFISTYLKAKEFVDDDPILMSLLTAFYTRVKEHANKGEQATDNDDNHE